MILVTHIWNYVWIIYISPSKHQRNIVQLCTTPTPSTPIFCSDAHYPVPMSTVLTVWIVSTVHYAARAMGATSLKISYLCLLCSPHPNIPDGKFNLVHHFFACKYSRQMKKGPVELGLQHPKDEVRYLENILFTLMKRFFHVRVFFHKSCKSKYHNIYKNKIFETSFVCEKHPPHVHVLGS